MSQQCLLFTSLTASTFLIYLDPQHGTNTVRTIIRSQMISATIGLLTFNCFGSGYLFVGSAMVITIALMIVLDVTPPPAVATSLSFVLKASNEKNFVLFRLAVRITAVLAVLEQFILWLIAH